MSKKRITPPKAVQWLFGGLALVVAEGMAAAAPPTYTAELLDLPNGYYSAGYFSSRGDLVGARFFEDGTFRGFVLRSGSYAQGPLGSSLADLNDAGDIAGTAPDRHAILVGPDGEIRDLRPELPADATLSTADRINEAGLVLGSYQRQPRVWRPYVWSPETGFRDLNHAGWAAIALAENGHVLLQKTDESLAVVLGGDGPRKFSAAFVTDLNIHDQVIGGDEWGHAIVKSPGRRAVKLPRLDERFPNTHCRATRINDKGVIVGWCDPGIAVAWFPDATGRYREIVNLGSRIVDAPPSRESFHYSAVGINCQGQILLKRTQLPSAGGSPFFSQHFLLTPVAALADVGEAQVGPPEPTGPQAPRHVGSSC